MPTIIYFTGSGRDNKPMLLTVDDDPADVFALMRSEETVLNLTKNGETVYINPKTDAYFKDQRSAGTL